jgi:hypothetical protein
MLIKWLRNRRDERIADRMEDDRKTRQNLLDSLRKSVDTNSIQPTLTSTPGTQRVVRPMTISREHFETMERLGASTNLLKKLRPLVRE